MNETVDEIYPSKYLKGIDVSEDLKVTVTEVTPEDMDDGTKLVMGFEELDKDLVLNKTNAKKMEKITGTGKFKEWSGEVVILHPLTVTYKGEDIESIRIKALKE